MSGWDDEIPKLPQQQKPNQNKPNNNNNNSKGGNNNQNKGQQQQQQQKPAAKQVFVEKKEDGPRRFQFFNSKAKDATTNPQEEQKSNTEQQAVQLPKNHQQLPQQHPKQQQQQQLQAPVSQETKQKVSEPILPPNKVIQQAQLITSPPCENANYNIPHQIVLRSKEGIFETSCFATGMGGEPRPYEGYCDFMILSKNDEYLVVTNDTVVSIVRIKDREVIASREFISVKNTSLSKENKFIQVYDRIDNNKYVAGIFEFPSFKMIREFNEKRYIKANAPYVKFNEDETKAFYYNYSTGFIEIYAVGDLHTVIQQAEMQNLDFFSISPKHEFIVGCFLEHMLGYEKTQAKLQFYNVEKDKRERVKNVEKAQEIDLKWSPDGNHVIIITQTTHDATGNTYYGQTALWLYSFGFKKLQQIPTIEGPVHDVEWNPNGENFIAIVGYMPAKPVLYTVKAEPIFSFGSVHRNTIRFQPQGRFVLFGGFGNISGDVDIWELTSFEKIAKFNAATSASIEWSLDGKYILSAVLTPRLRVDNNFKLFKWNGELVNSCNFSHTELYEVKWKPNQAYKDQSAIPEKDITDELSQQRKKTQAASKTHEPKFGGGNFAALLRNDRGDDGPKKITGNEEWLIKARNEAKKVKKEQ